MNSPQRATSKTGETPDSLACAAHIRQMLADTANHAREDVEKVNDPKAKALFETTAEVLAGLQTAYEHFERRAEEAWKIERSY